MYTFIDTEGDEEKKQLFYTYSGLTENSEKHQHHLASLRASLSSNSSTHDDKLAILYVFICSRKVTGKKTYINFFVISYWYVA